MHPRRPTLADYREPVLKLVASIPAGRFTTYGSLAKVMGINPRHVARILANLDETDATTLPWHRVLGAEGRLSPNLPGGLHEEQKTRLEAEGIAVNAKGYLVDPDRHFFPMRSI